jgi:hypothetical protein
MFVKERKRGKRFEGDRRKRGTTIETVGTQLFDSGRNADG